MKTANGKIIAEYVQMPWNDGEMSEANKKYYSPKMIEHDTHNPIPDDQVGK